MTAAERESLDAPQRYPGGQAMVFVRDVMTRDVIVIDPDRTVLDAAKRMAAKKIGGLVVVQHGRPIGLITDRDILWQVTSKEKNPSKILVRDVMTSPVATVSPLTTLRAAARVMLDKKTRWVVVTHLDNVEGIITASDLTWGFLETFARPQNAASRRDERAAGHRTKSQRNRYALAMPPMKFARTKYHRPIAWPSSFNRE